MLNFEYCSPTNFVFGKNTEVQVGELTAAYTKAKKVLLVYGSTRIEKNGLLKIIEDSLKKEGIQTVRLSGVQPNPAVSLVKAGCRIVREEGIDFVLAVGGGSVLDTGKAIACGALYDGDVEDFLTGVAEPEKSLSVGAVLTLAATGSEGSNCAVITIENGEKAGICNELIRPKFAIMDPALTCSVPKWHTACGSSDILAHIMEPYFTNTADVDLTDEFIEGLIRTVVKFAPVAIEHPDDYNARAQLMWCGTLANSGFFHVGRMADTTPHALGERMGADYTHGATLSVVIPAWMKYTYKSKMDRYVRYAKNVWGINTDNLSEDEAAFAGIQATEEFFKKLGAPVRLKELGFDPKTAPAMLADGGFDGWTQIPGFFFEMNQEDRQKIYELAAE